MRARSIKPGFFSNEQLAELPVEARLLFAGLWMIADREGRLEDRAKKIKMLIFPADTIDVEPLLVGLAENGLIERYEVDGDRFIWIPKFHVHQRPHHNELRSSLPPPAGQSDKFNHEPIKPEQRRRILERDDYTCQLCGSRENNHIDHKIPISVGGDSSDENLQVLCGTCNTKKRNKVNYELSAGRDPSNVDSTLTACSTNVGREKSVCVPSSLTPDSGLLTPESSLSERVARASSPDWSAVENLSQDDWATWLAHRRARKNPPYKTLREAQALARYPPEVQRAAIEISMDKGWTGLFPEKVSRGSNQDGRKPSAVERAQRATGGGF